MTITSPNEQARPDADTPPQSAATPPKGSRRMFFSATIGAFVGRTLADIATDIRKDLWAKLQDWLE